MNRIILISTIVCSVFLTSCVSKKEYLALQGNYDDLQSQLSSSQQGLAECNANVAGLQQQIASRDDTIQQKNSEIDALNNKNELLERELEFQKQNNTNLLSRMEELSILSKQEAENVRETLQSLNKQNEYIRDLNKSIQQKDSINLALVMNLKRSLDNINDEDIQIEVKKGVVYISISDKLLFRSGSAEVSQSALNVLSKVARVINDHSDIEVMVEGHTDNVPIKTNCLEDNWDLSVKRATSIVRLLQWRYNVDPARMVAAGRSEFLPKTTNETQAGRSENRRTEIIIVPQLDQFFSLLNAPEANTGGN
jgi:chemotaxis protein MotB